jgi:hypothetical protein
MQNQEFLGLELSRSFSPDWDITSLSSSILSDTSSVHESFITEMAQYNDIEIEEYKTETLENNLKFGIADLLTLCRYFAITK